MLRDNEVIKSLSLNAHFYKYPVDINRKFFNMYKKKALDEEESVSCLLLSLFNVHIEINEMIDHVYTL